jgi:Protein of unknown function DUF88.
MTINNYSAVSVEEISTAVFVDYECWNFGLFNQYGIETDLAGWFNDVKSRGHIDELHIFGDFRNELLAKDLPRLRTITNDIIDCTNPNGEKDYTDFIILDRIYQCAMRNNKIKQYIIFSGDGHFSSVSAFLKNFNDKIVGIYAVDGTLNPQLANSANWVQLISPPEQNYSKEIEQILQNLRWAELQKGLVPTFAKTATSVAKRSNIDQGKTTAALKYLIDNGYIHQEDKVLDDGVPIRALVTDWNLLIKHGLWNPAIR